jgi:putative ABC transport system permease protein
LHSFFQNLLLSARSLWRNPEFTLVAIFTLALGIAGNTAVFSIANATLLRPLPYSDSHRLVILRWQEQGDLSARAYFLLKNRTRSFSSVAAFYPVEVGVNIAGAATPQYVKSLSVTGDFFVTLGIQPEIGKIFSEEEGQAALSRTAVLSNAMWVRFGRDRSILTRDLLIDGNRYKIIGVMPEEFRSYPDADIWLPLPLSPGKADPGGDYRIIARLAPHISRNRAQYELEEISREYNSSYPPLTPGRQPRLISYDLQQFLGEKSKDGLLILSSAVALVFLIACSNVAVLLLIRTAVNRHAIAIRSALGGSRVRLVIGQLGESLLLSLAGGLLGLILAKESFPLLLALRPAGFPPNMKLAIDGRVLMFTFAVAVLGPLLFGLAPALQVTRGTISTVLSQTLRTTTSSAEQLRTVRSLVFCQMGFSIMLLAGTALLWKSLINLYSVPLGFDSGRTMVAQVLLSGAKYRDTASTIAFVNQVTEHLQGLPGIDSIGVVNGLPLDHGLNLPIYSVEAPQLIDHADEYRPVTPGFFPTFGIPLRSGRFLEAGDSAGNEPVAVINETMAARWWPNGSPLGKFVRVSNELGPQFNDAPRRIVGVVADVREKGPGLPAPPTIYVAMSQTPDNIMAFCNKVFFTSIVVRPSSKVVATKEILAAIQSSDTTLPLASFRPLHDLFRESISLPRFIAVLTTAFSGVSFVLATIGIYGLLSYQIRLSSRDIAVRLALGATRTQVKYMVLGQAVKLILFSVTAGIAGSLIIRSLLGNFVYNVQSGSLKLIVALGLFFALFATFISLLTATRAASIEPVAVLRNE